MVFVPFAWQYVRLAHPLSLSEASFRFHTMQLVKFCQIAERQLL